MQKGCAMSSDTMLDRLDRYYQEQGIPALGFNCKHRKECCALCAKDQMVSVPESYVGPGFEGGKLPRLLFLSSDTNDASWLKDPNLGTLRKIREIVTRDRLKNAGSNSHWYKTMDLARALLLPYANVRLGRPIDINAVVDYIAHVRSTRCKDLSIGTKEGNWRMSVKCWGFIKGEIEIMLPDIIVTQGTRAKNALWNTFPVLRQVSMSGYPSTLMQLVQIGATRTAIKIIAKHPCARGRNGWKSGEKKQFMDWAAKIVQECIPVA